jgi:hypothetical protein
MFKEHFESPPTGRSNIMAGFGIFRLWLDSLTPPEKNEMNTEQYNLINSYACAIYTVWNLSNMEGQQIPQAPP